MPTRERRAKSLGVPVDELPDGRGKGLKASGPAHYRARIPKPIKRGEDNGAAKLGGAEVRSIRRLLSAGLTQREIAARFGVSQQTISGIKAGKRWGHVE